MRAGQQQLEIRNRQQVGIYLQRAIDLKAAGNYREAHNEYQRVLTLDANNRQALESLQELQQILDPASPQQQNLEASTEGDNVANNPVAREAPVTEPTLDSRAQLWEKPKAHSWLAAGKRQLTLFGRCSGSMAFIVESSYPGTGCSEPGTSSQIPPPT